MGYYAVRGTLSPAGVASLRKMTAVKMRSKLQRLANELGGELADLYFNAGNFGVLAIFDLPSLGSSVPILKMIESGGFDPTPRMIRFEVASEFDAQLA